MAKILRKYGVWEWVLFLFGLFILIKLGIDFWNNTLENTMINGIALIVGLLSGGAPATLVEIAKQKVSRNESRDNNG